MSYYYRIKSFSIETTPGNSIITLVSYLSDSLMIPFVNGSTIDVFSVVTEKTSLPLTDYQSFFEQIALSFINTKYSKSLSGTSYSGSPILYVTDTTGLIVGMDVSGDNIPLGSTIVSVRDSTSVKISQNATDSGENLTFNFSPLSWTIDYTSIEHFLDVVNLDQL